MSKTAATRTAEQNTSEQGRLLYSWAASHSLWDRAVVMFLPVLCRNPAANQFETAISEKYFQVPESQIMIICYTRMQQKNRYFC